MEQAKLEGKIWQTFHKTCADYGLLQDGDRILVGLSGGKDSLALVELLGRQKRIYVPEIEVIAVYIQLSGRSYLSDTAYLADFCGQWEIPFYVRHAEIKGEERKDACFLCSWYRRKCLLQTAGELGCGKIALGHHQDDVLETMLLNLIYGGRFGSICPSFSLDKMPVTFIRPLYDITESDIGLWADLRGYAVQKLRCPFEKENRREQMHRILEDWVKINPNVRSSLMHALKENLFHGDK